MCFKASVRSRNGEMGFEYTCQREIVRVCVCVCVCVKKRGEQSSTGVD